ncbi:MAG: DNA methyltransferase, partial [Xanthobacteraceae bacterium]
AKVLRFNGNLFAEAKVLPLGREEIGELYEAAQKDWHEVEPAIFGTLLEQALDDAERHRLGAHYTPRAYVERLVIATIIEPLREDWRNVQAAAETKRAAEDKDGAADEVKAFHDNLCATRVLDPACGTGNFLYVSMELMKRLEGEVLEALSDLSDQTRFRGYELRNVDPHQFLGMEINPRAAAIAELVLWIGYLQWHFRTRGGIPPEPILRKFKNIEVKNAVLTWEGYPVPRVIDGKETYPNPRQPGWPTAEFIVGNPPFTMGGDFRREFGDARAEALWAAHDHINESADIVMYWWDRAAEILASKGTSLNRFGFVTTKSITQEYCRRVVAKRLDRKHPISIAMAIPNHPWTKATPDAAQVRIAMTVAVVGEHEGTLNTVVHESGLNSDEPKIEFETRRGKINSDLSIGVDVTTARKLLANEGICHDGVKLHGRGFIVTQNEAEHLGFGRRSELRKYIRPYRNGRDLAQISRGKLVIDLFGVDISQLRSEFPEIYQHLLGTVKAEREKVFAKSGSKDSESYARLWWLFGKPRQELRPALSKQRRYIATVDTARHRVFQFLQSEIVCDDKVVIIASDDGYTLGILQSHIHLAWALRAGGWLGVGNDPVYVKTKVFDPFPFPFSGELLKAQIAGVAEELDAFRKQRQKEHPELTLTQMYNVLEKIRADAALDEDDEAIKEKGLILILKELHDKLDRLVFEAYGWPQTLSDEEILEKLVALNHERAAEEKRGHVRWLRPDYQIPRFGKDIDKMAAKEEGAQIAADLGLPEPSARKPSFPADAVAQTAAVFGALASARGPVDAAAIAANYRKTRNLEATIFNVLESLNRLGHVSSKDGKTFEIRRVA